MAKLTRAIVSLPGYKVVMFDGADLEAYAPEDGSLRIHDYVESRGGDGMIFAAAAGQWLSVSLQTEENSRNGLAVL